MKKVLLKKNLSRYGYEISFIILFAILLAGCSGTSINVQPTRAPLKQNSKMPSYDTSLDFSKAALSAEDVKDLFPTASFSLVRKLQNDKRVGSLVLFPTEQREHTSDFAKGFSTQIEVYRDQKDATASFNAFLTDQNRLKSQSMQVNNIAEKTIAYKGKILTADGSELDGNEYDLMVKNQNVLLLITLRTDEDISVQTLQSLGQTVLTRLSN